MRQKLTAIPNTAPREKWIERISAAWREQVPSIFETGNLLEAAKAELKHGEWLAMVRDELPFDKRTAQRLMAIASCDNLREATHVSHLPSQWGTLYELTKLTDEQFAAGIESGAIHPKMERKDVNVLRGIEPKPKKKEELPKRVPWSLDRVCLFQRRTVLEAFEDIDRSQWRDLIAALRDELDDIEKLAQEREKHAA